MFHFLTYPLDVIKTNRILETTVAKETGEFAPAELAAIFERGGLQYGAMRGLVMSMIVASSQRMSPIQDVMVAIPTLSLAQNPFNLLMVQKQAVVNEHTPTYGEILKQIKNPMRLFTLGLLPTLGRNTILMAAFLPLDHQHVNFNATTAAVAFFAIFLS